MLQEEYIFWRVHTLKQGRVQVWRENSVESCLLGILGTYGRCQHPGQDIGQFLLHLGQDLAACVGDVVVLPGPALVYLDPAFEQHGLFQGVQHGIQASRTDVVVPVLELFFQSAPINGALRSLMQYEKFQYSLPEGVIYVD